MGELRLIPIRGGEGSYPTASAWVALHEPKRQNGATAIRRSSVNVGQGWDELSHESHHCDVSTVPLWALGRGFTTQARSLVFCEQ